MRDDRLSGHVEVLDEWDDDDPERPRPSRSWLAGSVALVGVCVVAALVLGQAQPTAVDHVPPTLPSSMETETPASPTPPSTTITPTTATTSPGRVALQLPVLASDDPAQPLRVSLLDPTPVAPSPGLVAYRVQVCVGGDAAGVGSETVRVAAGNWRLASANGLANPSTGIPGVAPRFPFESLLAKGQCASGYVTFAWNVVETANLLSYTDTRVGWYWRLT
ncbi:MAG TPA: hypothetical protein VFK68_12385 [Propionibacteriaceae bacterium]|nr:hypothetical protein [Propionibacteriaceae bacterium]